MKWTVGITPQAMKQIKRYPHDDQRLIYKKLELLERDPLHGNVDIVESGKYKGAYRQRIGIYRAFFVLNKSEKYIRVIGVLPRTKNTYR